MGEEVQETKKARIFNRWSPLVEPWPSLNLTGSRIFRDGFRPSQITVSWICFSVELLSLELARPFEDGGVVAGIRKNVRFLLQRPEDVGTGGAEVELAVVACSRDDLHFLHFYSKRKVISKRKFRTGMTCQSLQRIFARTNGFWLLPSRHGAIQWKEVRLNGSAPPLCYRAIYF